MKKDEKEKKAKPLSKVEIAAQLAEKQAKIDARHRLFIDATVNKSKEL